MITIWRRFDSGLQQVDQLGPGSWTDVAEPTTGEVARLQDEFGVPAEFLASIIDPDERARIDREDGALLVVLRTPHFLGDEADIAYETTAISIILLNDQVITVSPVKTRLIDQVTHLRGRQLWPGKRSRLVLQLLMANATLYLKYLADIDAKTSQAEDRLQRSLRNEEVQQLLRYQKSLVYFTTGLKSNELMIRRLQRSGLFDANEEDQELLEDVLTENDQAAEMTTISSNILSSMMDAYASIISNNLNTVMKFLASVTIILSIPTVVASIYGMNVLLPMADQPYGFYVTMGLALLAVAIVAYIFWRLDWL